MITLEDQVAIVTGAARGVGATIARTLVDAGAMVVCADIRDDAGEGTVAELGPQARFHHLDVTDEANWTNLVQAIMADYGRIDVLVNNAAILHVGTLESTPADTFRAVQDVNTTGPFLGTKAVAGPMKDAGRGSIVHVASIDGLVGLNALSAYTASKWALRGLARATALELGRSGIRVNTVCPASGNATMFAPWFEQMTEFLQQTEDYLENRAIPGGVPIQSIANAVLYLTSDASSHVTGIDIPIDGGATAGHFIPGFNTI
ncbi:MAG: SDR family oxidoreductase [Acidimicrobiales bacterium]|nr:SDR family oxidoreductase [Acidimicrobiales bacterium]